FKSNAAVSDPDVPDASIGDGAAPEVPAPPDGSAADTFTAADASAADASVADASATDSTAPVVGPSHVDITWMSISNIYYEMGPTSILTDGYVTRIPLSNFFGGGGGLAHTRKASKPDVARVSRVHAALGGPSRVNLLLTGHSHFDHSFDTATWSALTGAPIIG